MTVLVGKLCRLFADAVAAEEVVAKATARRWQVAT